MLASTGCCTLETIREGGWKAHFETYPRGWLAVGQTCEFEYRATTPSWVRIQRVHRKGPVHPQPIGKPRQHAGQRTVMGAEFSATKVVALHQWMLPGQVWVDRGDAEQSWDVPPFPSLGRPINEKTMARLRPWR